MINISVKYIYIMLMAYVLFFEVNNSGCCLDELALAENSLLLGYMHLCNYQKGYKTYYEWNTNIVNGIMNHSAPSNV